MSADAVLDNVLKSLTGTAIVLSTRPVHLVHFREEMARHLTTNQNQNSPHCFKKNYHDLLWENLGFRQDRDCY